VSIGNVITEHGLEEVASLDSGEMYSWSTTEVYFQRSSGRFFILSDSGCSCNYFGEGVDALDDFAEATRTQAIDSLRGAGGSPSAYSDLSADDVQREIAKVRDFR
jgi:hypothetical protein